MTLYKKTLFLLLFTTSVFANWSKTTFAPPQIKLNNKNFYEISKPEELTWFAKQINSGYVSITDCINEGNNSSQNAGGITSNHFEEIIKNNSNNGNVHSNVAGDFVALNSEDLFQNTSNNKIIGNPIVGDFVGNSISKKE